MDILLRLFQVIKIPSFHCQLSTTLGLQKIVNVDEKSAVALPHQTQSSPKPTVKIHNKQKKDLDRDFNN